MVRIRSFLMSFLLCVWGAVAFAQTSPLAEDLASQDDRGFIVGLLEDALGGEGRIVRVDGFQGALSSTATIQKMTIADNEGIWVTLEDIRLKWNRSALLRSQIDVEQLSASTLTLARSPNAADPAMPSAKATGFALPNLPVSVVIDLLKIDRILLGKPILGEAAEMSLEAKAGLAGGSGNIALIAQRLDGEYGRFAIDASYDAPSEMAAINIDLNEASSGIVARMLNLPRRPELTLQVSGAGSIDDLVTKLSLATDGVERLDGQVVVNGSSAAGRAFELNLQGDLTPLLSAEYHAFFGPSSVLRARGAQSTDGALELSSLDLKTKALSLQGSAALDATYAPLRLDLTGTIEPETGGSVILPLLGGDASIAKAALELRYDAAIGDEIDVDLRVDTLATPTATVDRANLAIKGALNTALGLDKTISATVAFQATGADFEDIALQQALGAQIDGALLVDYLPSGQLALSDIAIVGEQYALNGALLIKGVADAFETELSLRLKADRLAKFSTLVGADLRGQAALAITGKADAGGAFNLDLEGTTTDLGVGIAQVDQALIGNTKLILNVIRDETGTQVPSATVQNPQIKATASATLKTDASVAVFDVALADSRQIDPRLSGAVTLAGKVQQDTDGWSVDTKLSGPFGATTTVVGRVTGTQPALRFDASLPDVQPLVSQFRGPATLSGTAELLNESWFVATDLAGPYGITGALSGTVTGNAPELRYALRIPNVAALGAQIDGLLALEGTAAQRDTSWQIKTSLSGLSGTQARLSGQIFQNGTVDLSARGAASMALANPLIAPRNVQGRIEFDLAMRGTPNLSSLSGTLRTANGRLSAPTLRASLTDIAAQVELAGGRAQIDASAAVLSGGRITIRGPVVLTGARTADLAVSLDSARVVDPALFDTRVDGRLTLKGPIAGGALIAGRLTLAETNIRVPESQIAGFSIVPKIVHRNPSRGVRTTLNRAGLNTASGPDGQAAGAATIGLDIRIDAPSKIFVRGRGLDAELGGTLRLQGRSDQTISTGRFTLIRGRVDVLTKRFVLDEGQITLQGNFDPYLRFVASTRTASGTASIVIEGPASNPNVGFSSVPEAPEDEVLAQIFFGRDLSKLSAFQALQLASAVATLAGTGGEGIVSKLRRGFGLDDLDITTDEQGNTGLRLGKYISDNVYTDVTVGNDNTAGVSINIDLSPSVTARGQVKSNGNSSVGIYFEKDY